jgi:vanillate/4-hydroxybenzoate decarboxylase subunit D
VSSQAPGIDAFREPIDGSCPNCGESGLARYQVLAEGGWFEVVKCQNCLHSIERTRLDPLVLLGRRREF